MRNLILLLVLVIFSSCSCKAATITARQQGALRLYDTDNSNYVELKAAGTIGSDITFILPSADGTTGQILQTNGSGTLSFTNDDSTPTYQYVRLSSGTAWGSTDTKIRYFSTTDSSSGSGCFTATTNSTNGTYITMSATCLITITYSADFSAGRNFGISKNSSSLTTDFQSLTQSEQLAPSVTGSTDPVSTTISTIGVSSDVFRPHDQIAGATAGTQALFEVIAIPVQ